MNTKKKHILLVDDEDDFVELLAMRLRSHEYDVTEAYDGEEALRKAQDKPDIILLDIKLPKLDGYEVCRRLRQDTATRFIPIIMVTGKDAPLEKIEGLYIGADDYITKPFDPEELFARIEAVLRRTQKGKEFLEDKASSIHQINQIIREESMMPLFQPIFYLESHKLLGVEVLSRPPVKNLFGNTEALFDTAFYLGLHFDLEIACHKKAMTVLGDRARKGLICLNINPYLVEDSRYVELLSMYNEYTVPEMIGLELTERTSILNLAAFFKRLKLFKEKGFKILIDDLGSGYASLSAIVELKPDFVKIDLHLIRDIENDPVRQNLFKALVMFCRDSGITSIAEGIEGPKQLDILRKLGVDAGQGFYLGRPMPEIKEIWKLDK